MAVAIAVGRSGINTLLVLSQVVLAIVLPFIVFPLVWLTSARAVMSVRSDEPPRPHEEDDKAAATTTTMDGSCESDVDARNEADVDVEGDDVETELTHTHAANLSLSSTSSFPTPSARLP